MPNCPGRARKSQISSLRRKKSVHKMMEAVIASEVLEDENMKVDLPIEQMEVKEVEEEQNSYKDLRSGGDSPAKNFPTYPDSTATPRSQTIPYEGDLQLNSHGECRDESLDQPEPKDTKGEEISSKKCGI